MRALNLRGWAAALTLAMGIGAASAAEAAWHRAETERFVVFGEGREATVKTYASKLQAFDDVLRLYHPSAQGRKANTKVHVYLVVRQEDLRRVRPNLPRQIGGFYTAMNEGVFALAVAESGSQPQAYDIIFHEYAHHFMLENFPVAYPAWVVEGFAEYFMTTDITGDTVTVGGYNYGRAVSVLAEPWLPLEEVISKTTGETRPTRRGIFYAQAWLLTHYMRSDPQRAKQFDEIITATAKGEPPLQAFQRVTGMTMVQLTTALRGYKRLTTTKITMKEKASLAPEVKTTRLPDSADDLILDNLRLILAPTGQVDAGFLAAVRRKAAKYPDDVLAQHTLARAEFVMGDVAAGEAIMQRRLAAAANDSETQLLAGMGHVMAGLRDKSARQARFRSARPFLIKAYQLAGDDFRPLYAYALSRSVEPVYPNENDLNALLRARSLAPSVGELSLRAGEALYHRGDRELAAKVLAPVINNPHGGGAAAAAKAILEGRKLGEQPPAEDAAPEPAP